MAKKFALPKLAAKIAPKAKISPKAKIAPKVKATALGANRSAAKASPLQARGSIGMALRPGKATAKALSVATALGVKKKGSLLPAWKSQQQAWGGGGSSKSKKSKGWGGQQQWQGWGKKSKGGKWKQPKAPKVPELAPLVAANKVEQAVQTVKRFYGEASGKNLNHAQLFNALMALPQLANPDVGADFVKEVATAAPWPSENAWTYFVEKGRQTVFEFLGEAEDTINKIRERDFNWMVEAGKCVHGVTLSEGRKNGTIMCEGGRYKVDEDRRGLEAGDTVGISPIPHHIAASLPPPQEKGFKGGKGGFGKMGGKDGGKDAGKGMSKSPFGGKDASKGFPGGKDASKGWPGAAGQPGQDGGEAAQVKGAGWDPDKPPPLVECEVIVARPLVVRPIVPEDAKRLLSERRTLFRIDKLANRIQFSRAFAAIHLAAAPEHDIAKSRKRGGKGLPGTHRPSQQVIDVLLARKPGEAKVDAKVRGFDPKAHVLAGMNESQQRALYAAASSCVTLVQGPPGTGKTTCAVRILRSWSNTDAGWKDKAKDGILATSDSNIAVDNLVEGLAAEGVKVVRLGRPETTRPELLRHCVDEIARAKLGYATARDVPKEGRDREAYSQEIIKVTRDAKVVCCTAVGAGSGLLERHNFSRVLIDEASQATELATIIPFCRGSMQVVLCGDHCQLPPTVSSERAKEEGAELSLFERLVRDAGVRPHLLEIQYRMHPAISDFPRRNFYAGRLADGIDGSTRPAPKNFPWPDPQNPVAFVPVMGSSAMKDGDSFYNELEAQQVLRAVRDLIDGGLERKQIGVVTPYGAQVRILRRLLNRNGIPTFRDQEGVEVASVDGYQGREKEAIVMSTVRSAQRGGIGFVADWRRANVAMTRAKRGLIIFGDPTTLMREESTWAPWLRWVKERGLNMGPMPPIPDPPPGGPKPVGLAAEAQGQWTGTTSARNFAKPADSSTEWGHWRQASATGDDDDEDEEEEDGEKGEEEDWDVSWEADLASSGSAGSIRRGPLRTASSDSLGGGGGKGLSRKGSFSVDGGSTLMRASAKSATSPSASQLRAGEGASPFGGKGAPGGKGGGLSPRGSVGASSPSGGGAKGGGKASFGLPNLGRGPPAWNAGGGGAARDDPLASFANEASAGVGITARKGGGGAQFQGGGGFGGGPPPQFQAGGGGAQWQGGSDPLADFAAEASGGYGAAPSGKGGGRAEPYGRRW